MKKLMSLDYRFLVAFVAIVVFSNVYVENSVDKYLIYFLFPESLVFQALSLSMVAFMILFFCDNINYIVKMKNYIQVRIGYPRYLQQMALRIATIFLLFSIVFGILIFYIFHKLYIKEILVLTTYSTLLPLSFFFIFSKIKLSTVATISIFMSIGFKLLYLVFH